MQCKYSVFFCKLTGELPGTHTRKETSVKSVSQLDRHTLYTNVHICCCRAKRAAKEAKDSQILPALVSIYMQTNSSHSNCMLLMMDSVVKCVLAWNMHSLSGTVTPPDYVCKVHAVYIVQDLYYQISQQFCLWCK